MKNVLTSGGSDLVTYYSGTVNKVPKASSIVLDPFVILLVIMPEIAHSNRTLSNSNRETVKLLYTHNG